jgi:hypothetical protein
MGCFTCPRFTPVQWRTSEGTNASSCSSTVLNGLSDSLCSEDLNVLVKRHIQSVVSASPSRALATLENDAAELIAQGMVTVNAKLKGVEDEKLVARVVEVWGFFWDQVLTYLEGVCEKSIYRVQHCLLVYSGFASSSNRSTTVVLISYSKTPESSFA